MSAVGSLADDAKSELGAVKGVEKGGEGVGGVDGDFSVVFWRSGEEELLKDRDDREDRWARKREERGCGRAGSVRSAALVAARRGRQRVHIMITEGVDEITESRWCEERWRR